MSFKMKKFRVTYEETVTKEALIEINDENVQINSDDDLKEYLRNETFYNVEFLEEDEVNGIGCDIDTFEIIEYL
nr:MAG TPA: hypothetical protein [Caudoviricetes sp.]